MKKMNKKLITLMLAGTLCAGAAGALVAGQPVKTSADDAVTGQTYALTTVFNSNVSDVIKGDSGKTAFHLKNGTTVEYKNDLAYKWYDAEDSEHKAKYLNFSFTFAELNFKSISFVFENAPAQATKDDTSVNTVKFTYDGTVVKVGVLHGDETETTMAETSIAANTTVSFALKEGVHHGEFDVLVDGNSVGTMTNIGLNYADTSEVDTLVIKAETDADKTSVLYLNDLNGQSFGDIVDGKVEDKAKPVLVVNDAVSGFLLGTQFSLDYVAVDVLDTDPSIDEEYYQFNPADAAPEYVDLKTGSSATYFMPTTYYVDGSGSVYKEAGEGRTKTSVCFEYDNREFVSIQFILGDDTYKTSETKVTYDLAWYVTDPTNDLVPQTQGEGEAAVRTDFLILDRNEEGPAYSIIELEDKVNKKTDDWQTQVDAYQEKLDEVAKEVYAGSNATLELPSLAWLISDNNGYQSLDFMASYRTPSSTSAKSWSSTKDFDELEFTATEEGKYEFKIFATDKAGNAMKYYLDGELVSVSTSNIWDIEEIPSFTYTIRNQGVKAEEKSDKVDTEILGETYKMSSATIIGAASESSDAALYRIDITKYNDTLTGSEKRLSSSVLSGIKYSAIQEEVGNKILEVTDGDYFKVYLNAYVNLLAKALGVDADNTAALAALKSCFKRIADYDDRIPEDEESDNEYAWDRDTKSFTAAEEGLYMILADYWDDEFAYVDRVAAYMLIEVDAEADEIAGETNWFKNNMVSVILFAIAGIMLILIIILLLIKPSDETLEDVEEKASKKKASKKKDKKD